jgi:CubicO group peptidase (beta-lactamase class C family)
MSSMRCVAGVSWATTISLCARLCAIGPGSSQAADLEQLLKDGRVPGLAFAVIRDGKIVETKGVGVRDISTSAPVDQNTIFEAASLSKPVFAFAVLQLVDAGALSLDAPLAKYVPDYVKDDPRAALITVRNILDHTSDLPN